MALSKFNIFQNLIERTNKVKMEKRVVITGLGAITPIGKTANETWNAIENKKCGIDNITLFNTETFKTKLVAEVKEYNPLDYFDLKQTKRFDRCTQFAVIAAREAVENSGITKENTNYERVGTYVSSGIGGLTTIQEQCIIQKEIIEFHQCLFQCQLQIYLLEILQ